MNIILIKKEEIKNNVVTLKDDRHIHIKTILKPKINQELAIGIFNQKLGKGKLIKQTSKQTILEIKENKAPPKPKKITLVCALPRPKTLQKVVYIATCLGIKEIHFINTKKVEKSFWDKKQHKTEKTIEEALSQSKDTIPPTIDYHKRFKPFCEDLLPKLIKDKAYFAHPGKGKPSKAKHITVIIGPEGGFTDFETTLLEKYAKQIDLGERILRVEHALPVASGMLTFK